MPTIEKLAERATPVTPDTLGVEVFTYFRDNPSALVLPVVDAGRPVGLIERNAFLLQLASPLGHALYGKRPVTEVMDAEPSVVEAGVRIDSVCDAILGSGDAALMRGFIVTREGQYWGVGTVVSLLKAVNDSQQAQSQSLRDQIRDLSDASVQAQTAARSRSEFLSVLSHELRTPLNGVLAVAELLKRQPLNAAAQSHVQTIVESSDSLLHILQDSLDLARAEAGELDLDPRPTPLRALMDEVAAHWEPRAAEDNVQLLVRYEGDTELSALIDDARLKQVFDKLIGNALKFARNSMVEAGLKAWVEQGQVMLQARVRDDGPGIAPERVNAIFEPFVHGAGPDGAGLGLAICRKIIDGMKGRIWAENNPGRGATFAFDITCARAESATVTESNVAELVESEIVSNPHILIVDDNATNRVVAQALCEMFGCTSETADDGMEALAAVKARDFDLVLMDIKMPRMDGLQATQAIRKLKGPMRNVPIIALTANADPDDAKRYVASGMAAVVEKPIKPERLMHAMNTALSAADAGTEEMPRAAAG